MGAERRDRLGQAGGGYLRFRAVCKEQVPRIGGGVAINTGEGAAEDIHIVVRPAVIITYEGIEGVEAGTESANSDAEQSGYGGICRRSGRSCAGQKIAIVGDRAEEGGPIRENGVGLSIFDHPGIII